MAIIVPTTAEKPRRMSRTCLRERALRTPRAAKMARKIGRASHNPSATQPRVIVIRRYALSTLLKERPRTTSSGR